MLLEEIADDFRNAAGGFWTDDEELHDMSTTWLQNQAQAKLEEIGLSFSLIRKDLKWRFHQIPQAVYGEAHRIVAGSKMSQAQLGRRYGVDRATIHRWLKANEATGKRSKPSFESFCIVSAAEDLTYPRGSVIALQAYHAAFEELLVLMGMNDQTPPSAAELVCLYCYQYSREWWNALLRMDEERLQEAAGSIEFYMNEELGIAGNWGIETFDRLFVMWWKQWYVLTAALPYEWF
jgi:transcriptional regulator with XRE-family HTH domain